MIEDEMEAGDDDDLQGRSDGDHGYVPESDVDDVGHKKPDL